MTIAAVPSRAQVKTGDMYGGGMAEKARIIKTSLTNIFPLIEKQNVLLVLLNQVMAEIGGWKPGVTSAGGSALKHDVHMRIKVDGGKTEYDGVYAVEKNSTLSLEKSKVSPIMNGIKIILDITKGGIIDREASLMRWMIEDVNPDIFKVGGWYSVNEDYLQKYKVYWERFGFDGKFRQNDLYERIHQDPNFKDFMQLIWLDLISHNYTLQAEVCKEMRDEVEKQLITNLGLTQEELESMNSITEEVKE